VKVGIGLVGMLIGACLWSVAAGAGEPPLKWNRTGTDEGCRPRKLLPGTPPRPGGIDPANRPEDANIAGHPNGSKDWLIDVFHWDDGQNDLTVEIWCIRGSPSYFSSRILQSKKGGGATVVATPDGGGGTVPAGPC
jgi:hypothetical protein